jgi:hypothetical protein
MNTREAVMMEGLSRANRRLCAVMGGYHCGRSGNKMVINHHRLLSEIAGYFSQSQAQLWVAKVRL